MSKASRGFENSAKNYYSAGLPQAYASYSGSWAANDDLPKLSDMPENRAIVIRNRERPKDIREMHRVQREHHDEIMVWCKDNNIRLTCPGPMLMRDDDGNKVFVLTFKKIKHAVMAKLARG